MRSSSADQREGDRAAVSKRQVEKTIYVYVMDIFLLS